MQKILFVINNMKIGGIQKSLVNLLNEISYMYDIHLVIFYPYGELMELLPKNIKIISVNPLLQVLGISQKESYKLSLKIILLQTFGAVWSRIFGNKVLVNWLVKKNKIDEYFDYAISYAHFQPLKYFLGGTNEFVLNCVNAKNKITFVHGDFKNYGGNSKYARKKYQLFDKVAFCSKSIRDGFLEIMPELSNKTYVVENFNSYSKIKDLAYSNVIIYPKDYFNVVSICRLSSEKGINKSIEAVKYCLEKNLKVKYHIVGDGPEKNRLQELTRRLGLNNNVFFYAETSNPYVFLPNADLLLFPSVHEAAGLIVEEAAFLGIPVLATKTISSKEMILDKGYGWVCANEDNAFAKELEYLLLNKDKIMSKKKYLNKIKFNNVLNLKQFYKLINE